MPSATYPPLPLIRALFRGREDVFALRWEKAGKSGYMPAHQFDLYHYREHKRKGGTWANYPHKSYLPLTDHEIQKHLSGRQQIGIYPLLEDNTSWFIVADFDNLNWKEEARTLLLECRKNQLPAYLERSRSGNGGHVWIFFNQPIPAIKSRRVLLSLLEQSGLISPLDKNSSFDRLFPNQDSHSGKGLGNLIALPFFEPAMREGNSLFIHPETFEPFADQWQFLNEIERAPASLFDELYTAQPPSVEHGYSEADSPLVITLQRRLHLHRDQLSRPLISFLREQLNFANSEYFIKKGIGRSTYGSTPYFNLMDTEGNNLFLPRGFVGKLIRYCTEEKIPFKFKDNRKKKEEIPLSFKAKLRPHQEKGIDAASRKDFGVIVAPPGSGKTLMGLKIIADKKQPALIIVHRRQLLEQWRDRVEVFLGIPRHEIGIIGNGKARQGKAITLATIQSLPGQLELVSSKFGTILVDECHHIPAKTYRSLLHQLDTYYLYGLTATPFRKYNDDKLIFAYMGDIIIEIDPTEIEDFKPAQVIVRNTELDVPYNSKTDPFENLSKILIHDTQRNKLILQDINEELAKGKRIVIITERKEQIDALHQFLKSQAEVITLSGDESENSKQLKWNLLKKGDFQALITTGQYFGEGSDLTNIHSLFLVYPFAFKGKLIQYIGRIQRAEINPTVFDYRDINIDYLNKLFLKRNTYYRQMARYGQWLDDPMESRPASRGHIIEKSIKVDIEDLDFRYGHVGFEYLDKKTGQRLDFEIENDEFRPEFDVLKPYLIKVLKSRSIRVSIYAEIDKGVILSQRASSGDIERMEKEFGEKVKLSFIHHGFIRQAPPADKNLLHLEDLPENQRIHTEVETLLDDLLKNRKYRHTRQIQFLADQHARDIMKLRFVLQPFSLLFLIRGQQNDHFVLETLDTDEATYLWHTKKCQEALNDTLNQIENALKLIREKGRLSYLENPPANFSRIVHDYSEKSKGFILWKSVLEERLT